MLAPAEAGDGGDSMIIYGNEGNDKIEGISNITGTSKIYGGAGDDKMISGSGLTADNYIEGNDGDDIIYGADDGVNDFLYGDFPNDGTISTPTLGGDDKIYGSDNLTTN